VLPDGVEYRIGLGSCFCHPKVSLSQLDPNLQTLREWRTARRVTAGPAGRRPALRTVSFPLVANLKIPVARDRHHHAGVIIIIGPVNIILLTAATAARGCSGRFRRFRSSPP